MKKPSSLAQQIQQAQRIYDSWTPEHKSSVRLEGASGILTRFAPKQTIQERVKEQGSKK